LAYRLMLDLGNPAHVGESSAKLCYITELSEYLSSFWLLENIKPLTNYIIMIKCHILLNFHANLIIF
jgi:hypothetical protein